MGRRSRLLTLLRTVSPQSRTGRRLNQAAATTPCPPWRRAATRIPYRSSPWRKPPCIRPAVHPGWSAPAAARTGPVRAMAGLAEALAKADCSSVANAPICSLVAPCRPGASPFSVRRGVSPRAASRNQAPSRRPRSGRLPANSTARSTLAGPALARCHRRPTTDAAWRRPRAGRREPVVARPARRAVSCRMSPQGDGPTRIAAVRRAEVAQSVEHMTENHGVGSSILPLGTTHCRQ